MAREGVRDGEEQLQTERRGEVVQYFTLALTESLSSASLAAAACVCSLSWPLLLASAVTAANNRDKADLHQLG